MARDDCFPSNEIDKNMKIMDWTFPPVGRYQLLGDWIVKVHAQWWQDFSTYHCTRSELHNKSTNGSTPFSKVDMTINSRCSSGAKNVAIWLSPMDLSTAAAAFLVLLRVLSPASRSWWVLLEARWWTHPARGPISRNLPSPCLSHPSGADSPMPGSSGPPTCRQTWLRRHNAASHVWRRRHQHIRDAHGPRLARRALCSCPGSLRFGLGPRKPSPGLSHISHEACHSEGAGRGFRGQVLSLCGTGLSPGSGRVPRGGWRRWKVSWCRRGLYRASFTLAGRSAEYEGSITIS